MYNIMDIVFFSSRRRNTRCALVTGVQTCALPIYWAQVLDTNLTGVWRVGQAVARRMAPLGRGSIINISSMALLQRLAAVRGRLSLCADQAAAAKWWLSMPMASVSAEGPM